MSVIPSSDLKDALQGVLLSGDTRLIQVMLRLGLPVREAFKGSVREELWHDDDYQRIGYREKPMEASWRSVWSRCKNCGIAGLYIHFFVFRCDHHICKTCKDCPFCPCCGPDTDQLWEMLTYMPEKHESPEVQWPTIVHSPERLHVNTPQFDGFVHEMVQASIMAFTAISLEENMAFALKNDARGFQAFNRSHLTVGKIAAKQSLDKGERHTFWMAVCVSASQKKATLLHRTLYRALFIPNTLDLWDLDDPVHNPICTETLAPIRGMQDFYKPAAFWKRVPLLSRKLARTGQFVSRFPTYDIVQELCDRHAWDSVQRKWARWIGIYLNAAVRPDLKLAPKIWSELVYDFADICSMDSNLEAAIMEFGEAREVALDFFSSTAIIAGRRTLDHPDKSPAELLSDEEVARIKKLMEKNPRFVAPFVHEETRNLYEHFFWDTFPYIGL